MESATASVSPPSLLQKIIRKRLLGTAFLLALAILAGIRLGAALLENPSLFLQQVINGLQLGFVYALIALGYTMVYGIVRLINFAHGDVFMVGAFTSYFAITRFQLHLWLGKLAPNLPEWLVLGVGTITVILVSMITCAFLAVIIERVAYKPLRTAPRISALITAIGVSFFLEYFGALDFVYTPNFITYQRPFPFTTWIISREGIQTLLPGQAGPEGGVTISSIAVIIIITSIFLLLLLNYIVGATRIGKAMRATAYDKPTARLMGINVDGIISITFAIGASLAERLVCCMPSPFPRSSSGWVSSLV